MNAGIKHLWKNLGKYKNHYYFTLLIGACLFAYWPQLNGEFIWDDFYHFSPYRLELFKESPFSYQWILTLTTYLLFDVLFGENLLYYKLTCLTLHIINGILLYRILKLLKMPTLFIISFFLLHPMQTMAVSWISQVKTLLAAMFILLAYLHYLKWDTPLHKYRKLSLSLIFIVISIMFKWSFALLTIPLIIKEALKWKDQKFFYPVVISTVLAISAFCIWYIYSIEFIQEQTMGIGSRYYELFYQQTNDYSWLNFWCVKMLFSIKVFSHYLFHSFIPFNLSPLYNANDFFFWKIILQAQVVFLFFFLLFKLKMHNILKAYYLGFLSLVPVLGFMWAPFMNFTPVSHQHSYLFIGASGLCLYQLIKYCPINVQYQKVAMFLIISALSLVTYRYNYHFKNDKSFWRRTTKMQPKNFIAHINLSTVYAREESYLLARRHIEKAANLALYGSYLTKKEQELLFNQIRSLPGHIPMSEFEFFHVDPDAF